MLDTGIRVALIAPSMLFLVALYWSVGFNILLEKRLKESGMNPIHAKDAVGNHFMQIFFAQSIVLFMANGLATILELGQAVSGVLQLFAGIVLGFSGVLNMLVSGQGSTTRKIFSLVIGLCVGQVGYLLIFGISDSVCGEVVPIVVLVAVTIAASFLVRKWLSQ